MTNFYLNLITLSHLTKVQEYSYYNLLSQLSSTDKLCPINNVAYSLIEDNEKLGAEESVEYIMKGKTGIYLSTSIFIIDLDYLRKLIKDNQYSFKFKDIPYRSFFYKHTIENLGCTEISDPNVFILENKKDIVNLTLFENDYKIIYIPSAYHEL